MAVALPHHHHQLKPSAAHRCKLQSFTQLDFSSVLHLAARFHRSFSTPCLSLSPISFPDHDHQSYTDPLGPQLEILAAVATPGVRALVDEVTTAVASGIDPVPVATGLGGAYLLRAPNGNGIAVAKPMDEEPLACNNPKGFVGRTLGQPGLKPSVRVGETGVRELAAYLLDHGGFAGVPPTALVKFSQVGFNVNNPAAIPAATQKIASLQRFVEHDSDAGDLGPSGFSVVSVHRIAILDVRLLNLDRHAGNILVRNSRHQINVAGEADLVPIDHGLCLPEWIDDPYFEWLHWPQALIPFSDSEMEYISHLSPFKDAELLRTTVPSLRESSIRVFVICSIFLKRAAAARLSLADIGRMMTRGNFEESASMLENVCLEAKERMANTHNGEDTFPGEEETLEVEMIKYMDKEIENSSYIGIADVPRWLRQTPPEVAKPPKIPRFSLAGLDEEDGCGRDKAGGLTKSLSFSETNHHSHENGGVSFGEMSENEWEFYLVSFEKVLGEALMECTKSNMGLNLKLQRSGTSCKF
ncbi:phosphatidylinositol 4-kinase gamma 8 [Malania oleifera]|uniref:phosphatidylinositol 4-kinase gamma 8 n=1 Tax=Malania oleifera TaxID=397392 RepID=UPI0025AE54F6|nr:phosphatidylinositol 4-kinase gamma 8 [Malania oleifera]